MNGFANMELSMIYIFQLDSCGIVPGFRIVNVADAVGCKVDMAILLIWQFLLAFGSN